MSIKTIWAKLHGKQVSLKPLTPVEKNQDKENSSNNTILQREHVENTPFTIIETEGRFILVCGRYKVLESRFKSELLLKIRNKDWILISSLITSIIEYEKRPNIDPVK